MIFIWRDQPLQFAGSEGNSVEFLISSLISVLIGRKIMLLYVISCGKAIVDVGSDAESGDYEKTACLSIEAALYQKYIQNAKLNCS